MRGPAKFPGSVPDPVGGEGVETGLLQACKPIRIMKSHRISQYKKLTENWHCDLPALILGRLPVNRLGTSLTWLGPGRNQGFCFVAAGGNADLVGGVLA